MYQAVSTITSLEEQLQGQNVNSKAILMKAEDSSRNLTAQDPSPTSSNATHTMIKFDTQQQFCSSPQSLEGQANTSMAMISNGNTTTSSYDIKPLAVSVSRNDKVTPFCYDQKTLHQHNSASENREAIPQCF